MKFKYIVFDMDGTLLNTLDDLRDSVNFALTQKGYPNRSLDEIRSFVGNGVALLVHRAVPVGTPESDEKECLAIFKKHYEKNMNNKTAPYPGVNEMLKKLQDNGFKMAVVSNKFEPALKELCKLCFNGLLDIVVGQVDSREQKPAPDGVWYAMEQLGADLESTVYVGDSEVDVLTAKNSKLPCIGVTWGFRDREVLEEGGAEYIIDNVEDIFNIVK